MSKIVNIIFKNYKLLNETETVALLKVRNMKHVRENSHTNHIITLKEHENWIKTLNNDEKLYFAVLYENEIIGGVNIIDLGKQQTPQWGLFFKNDLPPLIVPMVAYLFLDYVFLNLDSIESEIKKGNDSAYRLSMSLGMKDIKETDDITYFRLTKSIWEENKSVNRFVKSILRRLSTVDFKIKTREYNEDR